MAVDPAKLQSVVENLERSSSFRNAEALSYKVAQTNWAQEEELSAAAIQKLFKKHSIKMKAGTVPPATPTSPPAPVVPVATIKPPAPKEEEAPKPAPPAKETPKAVPPAKETPKEEEAPKPPPSATGLPTPKYKPVAQTQPAVLPSPKDAPPPKPVAKKEEPPPTPNVTPPVTDEEESKEEEGDSLTDEGDDGSEDRRYEDGGKGRKQCLGCKKYVGAKTKTCFCGHEFEAKAGTVTARREYFAGDQHAYLRMREALAAQKAAECGARNILWTPAKQAPVDLKGTTLILVQQWAEAVREHCRVRYGYFVCLSALTYWANAYVNKPREMSREDIKKVCRHLLDVYSDEWAEPPTQPQKATA